MTNAAVDERLLVVWRHALIDVSRDSAFAGLYERRYVGGLVVAHCLRCGDDMLPLASGRDPISPTGNACLTRNQRWGRALLQHEQVRHPAVE
jgi:hypothetical protein